MAADISWLGKIFWTMLYSLVLSCTILCPSVSGAQTSQGSAIQPQWLPPGGDPGDPPGGGNPSPTPPCTNPTGLANGGATYSYWAPGSKITVYADASLTKNEIQDIQAAVSAWASASGVAGNNITFSSIVVGPAPANTMNVISFVNNPSGSTNNLAYTNPLLVKNSQGQNTNQIGAATVNLNKGYKFNGAAGPTLQYNPNGKNPDGFFTSAMEHELGHALGLDHPAGTSDTTNWCQYSAATSIMDGACGQNDQGDGTAPGGKLPATVTNCDKTVQNNNETSGKQSGPTGGGPGGPGGGLGPGSGGCSGTPENDTCSCSGTTWFCECTGSPYTCSDGSESECDGGQWSCPTVTTSQCDGSAPCQGAVCVGPNQWDTSGCSTSCSDVCDPSCSNYNPSDPSCGSGGTPPGGGDPGPGGGDPGPGDPGSGCDYPDDYCDDGSGDGTYYAMLRDFAPVGGIVLATALPLIGFRKRKRDEDSK